MCTVFWTSFSLKSTLRPAREPSASRQGADFRPLAPLRAMRFHRASMRVLQLLLGDLFIQGLWPIEVSRRDFVWISYGLNHENHEK